MFNNGRVLICLFVYKNKQMNIFIFCLLPLIESCITTVTPCTTFFSLTMSCKFLWSLSFSCLSLKVFDPLRKISVQDFTLGNLSNEPTFVLFSSIILSKELFLSFIVRKKVNFDSSLFLLKLWLKRD